MSNRGGKASGREGTPSERKFPYQERTVWTFQMIKTKPGKTRQFLESLKGRWQAMMEEAVRSQVILSYRIFMTPFTLQDDWNIILAFEVASMGAIDGLSATFDGIASTLGSFVECKPPLPGETVEDIKADIGTKLMWSIELT